MTTARARRPQARPLPRGCSVLGCVACICETGSAATAGVFRHGEELCIGYRLKQASERTEGRAVYEPAMGSSTRQP